MAIDGLNNQIEQYQQRFREFLSDIDDGTFEGELDKLQESFDQLPDNLKKDIMSQIQTYKNDSPTGSIPGFLEFIGRAAANSLLGPLGTSAEDINTPQRLLQKLKRSAITKIQGAVAKNVPSPSKILLNALGVGRRGSESLSHQEIIARQEVYEENLSEFLNNLGDDAASTYITPYDDKMRRDLPKPYRRLRVVQDNSGNTFHKNYKILHEDDDIEIDYELSKHLIKFHITNNDKTLIFRMANFNAFNDVISPEYNDVNYVGRPEALKQYTGVNRNISFSFDVVIEERDDVAPLYKKLDILAGLCYPNKYTHNNMMQPNVLRLSVGHYLKRIPFFPTSIALTADDEMPHSMGKPRIITITISGDIIQPESDPQLNLDSVINKFINQSSVSPANEDEDAPDALNYEQAKEQIRRNIA